MSPADFLTVQEFADLIRVHPRTVYRRIWANRQPGVLRFGRDIRIHVPTALQPAQTPVLSPPVRRPALGGVYTGV